MPSTSLKKLGKRPALSGMDGLDIRETNALTQSPGITPAHQKRVLPSRSRRGGPGVGNCSVDLLIMDTERRAKDSRPVIPPTQKFFLTTNPDSIPPPPEASAPDGESAGSYFDKPEVKAAYLAARAIQVPEFSPLPDDAVGGRLRARAEEEGPETSDDAYLTRHRKYETFEKRQRRREKEKLVHERYKLKERIEQLKGMDATAFGGGGEARRKDMLDIAEDLEMRYAVLLPPEPRRNMKKDEIKRRKSDGMHADTTTGDDADVPTEDEDVDISIVAEVMHPAPTGTRSTKARKMSVRLEPQSPVMTRMSAISVALASESPQHTYIAPPTPSPNISSRVRDSSGRFLLTSKSESKSPPPQPTPELPSAPAPQSWQAPPPRKRPRIEKRKHSPEYNPIHTSVLLQIAARKAAQPQARQTSRSMLAFGFPIPLDVSDEIFFELPEWLATGEELEHIHETRARSTTRSASPNPLGHVPNGMKLPNDAENNRLEVATNIKVHKDDEHPKEVASDTLSANALVNGADEGATSRRGLPTSSVREENEDVDIVMTA